MIYDNTHLALVEKFVVKDLRLEKKLPITAPVIDFCFQIRVFRDMKSLIVHKEDGNRDSAVRNFFFHFRAILRHESLDPTGVNTKAHQARALLP